MVKKIVLFSSIILSLSRLSYAGIVPEDQRVVESIDTVQMSKDSIFSRTLEWAAITFRSSRDVIQLQDSSSGKIVIRGILEFKNLIVLIPCEFTLSIDIRDNKYRVRYDNFVGLYGPDHADRRPVKYSIELDQVKKQCADLTIQLAKFMRATKSDDF
jgi:hypothetical protein